YMTPTGFTLPSDGSTVTGTYQWNARYSGDASNNAASDIGAADERVTVSPASPTLVTIASPDVILPTGPPGTVTLTDSAVLVHGFNPPGCFSFALRAPPGSAPSPHTVRAPATGPSSASTPLPPGGTVAGSYPWTAHYSGDGNNNAADDQGAPA